MTRKKIWYAMLGETFPRKGAFRKDFFGKGLDRKELFGIILDMETKDIAALCLASVLGIVFLAILPMFVAENCSALLRIFRNRKERKKGSEWKEKLRSVLFRYARYCGRDLPAGQTYENPRIERGNLVIDHCKEVFGRKIVFDKVIVETSPTIFKEREGLVRMRELAEIVETSPTIFEERAMVVILERILEKMKMKNGEELELFLESGGW